MDVVIGILFSLLATTGAALVLANLIVAVLRLSHRNDQAQRVARVVSPYAAFLRLGGSSKADYERSKHA